LIVSNQIVFQLKSIGLHELGRGIWGKRRTARGERRKKARGRGSSRGCSVLISMAC
jgi:hypothetical protein